MPTDKCDFESVAGDAMCEEFSGGEPRGPEFHGPWLWPSLGGCHIPSDKLCVLGLPSPGRLTGQVLSSQHLGVQCSRALSWANLEHGPRYIICFSAFHVFLDLQGMEGWVLCESAKPADEAPPVDVSPMVRAPHGPAAVSGPGLSEAGHGLSSPGSGQLATGSSSPPLSGRAERLLGT